MHLDEECYESAQDSRSSRSSAAIAAKIFKKNLSLISLFAIVGGVGYHMSIPAGLGCAGLLVWIDLSIADYQRGSSADR